MTRHQIVPVVIKMAPSRINKSALFELEAEINWGSSNTCPSSPPEALPYDIKRIGSGVKIEQNPCGEKKRHIFNAELEHALSLPGPPARIETQCQYGL